MASPADFTLQTWPDREWAFTSSVEAASALLLASGLATLIFAIGWVVWWRRYPDRGWTASGLCLIVLALLWGFTALLGARTQAISFAPATIPFLSRPFVAGPIAVLFLVLGVRQLRRSGFIRDR